MKNNLQIFKNEEFGEVRTIDQNRQILFCGSDVAKALGYIRPNDAISTHCKSTVKRSIPHPQSDNKDIEMAFITEGDVYRLIVRSNLPTAEKFEKWVFDEVLPTIRKTGGYIPVSEEDTETEILAKAFIIANKTIEEQKQRIGTLEIKNSELTVNNQIMQPKADYFDELVDRNLLTGVRETATALNIGERIFVKFLIDNKYLYRDKKGKLKAYANNNNGLFVMKECFNEKTEWSGQQLMFTPKGREHFRLLCQGLRKIDKGA